MTSKTPDRSISIVTTSVDTPVGTARVASRHDGTVLACRIGDGWDQMVSILERRIGPVDEVEGDSSAGSALGDYFAGNIDAIDGLDVDPPGTDFQCRVWAALRTIPTGTTWSYRDLARAVGEPGATRAVGTANGANPIWLIVPCHRVIRSDGALGGYAGGVETKSWLLAHEGAVLA